MAQLLTILLASSLMIGGALLHPPTEPLPGIGRHLARPIVLPFLWRGLQNTKRTGSIQDYVAQGQTLMKFIPEWSIGHVHFANQLAYDGVQTAASPDIGVDRLAEAIQLLERAMRKHPAGSETYLKAAAALLYVQCNKHPAVAEAFAQRLGNPFQLAETYLRRIPRFRDSAFLQDQIPFLFIDGIPHQILLAGNDWRDVASRTVATATNLIKKLRNQNLAAPWQLSLGNLNDYLQGSSDISMRNLAKDPRLAKIVKALNSRVR